MAVPKKKTSKSRRDMRRSHLALVSKLASTCQNCGEPKHSHHMCGACGHYKGRQVVDMTPEAEEKEEEKE